MHILYTSSDHSNYDKSNESQYSFNLSNTFFPIYFKSFYNYGYIEFEFSLLKILFNNFAEFIFTDMYVNDSIKNIIIFIIQFLFIFIIYIKNLFIFYYMN